MKKFLTTILSFTILVALSVPVFAQQARQVGARSVSSDQMMERLKQGMEERFDEMDEDEDGSLSLEEFKKLNTPDSSTLRGRSTTSQRIGTTSTTSTNRASSTQASSSTQSTKAMAEEAKREREKELEKQFEKFDDNEDGKLTKEEYLEAQGKAVQERMERSRGQRGEGGQRGQRQGRATPAQRGP